VIHVTVKRSALDLIKSDLESCVGKHVKLKANRGRRKVVEAEGILEQTYPKVFLIRLDAESSPVKRLSYSYADVLTETVELIIDDTRIGVANL
jgi:uncharacterized protein Veg